MKLSFGNGGDEKNSWHKYHIDEDKATRKLIIERIQSIKEPVKPVECDEEYQSVQQTQRRNLNKTP